MCKRWPRYTWNKRLRYKNKFDFHIIDISSNNLFWSEYAIISYLLGFTTCSITNSI